MSKNEYFENNGHNFFHISQLNIVFITGLPNATYLHYLQIRKPMIEWTLLRKIATSPKLIKAFDINKPHPLLRKFYI